MEISDFLAISLSRLRENWYDNGFVENFASFFFRVFLGLDPNVSGVRRPFYRGVNSIIYTYVCIYVQITSY